MRQEEQIGSNETKKEKSVKVYLDGKESRLACQTLLEEGMRVETISGIKDNLAHA